MNEQVNLQEVFLQLKSASPDIFDKVIALHEKEELTSALNATISVFKSIVTQVAQKEDLQDYMKIVMHCLKQNKDFVLFFATVPNILVPMLTKEPQATRSLKAMCETIYSFCEQFVKAEEAKLKSQQPKVSNPSPAPFGKLEMLLQDDIVEKKK